MSLGWRGEGEWRCATALRLGGIRLGRGGGCQGAALRLGGIRGGKGWLRGAALWQGGVGVGKGGFARRFSVAGWY
jgi:hypothetical protein